MNKVNFPAKEKANVTRPCLVAACRGNENIADLLNYLIYEAHDLLEKKKVEGNNIPLQLTHDKMLNRPNNEGKRFNFSERSLIGYLRRLDEWKLVTSGKYSHSQVVHIDTINKTIANPPEKPKGKPRGRHKSGNVEANKLASKCSTSLSQENVELKLKVEKLQQNVEMLQHKVEMFQDFVETFQHSKSSNGALQADGEAKNCPVYSVDSVDSVDFFTGATFRGDEEDITGPSPDKNQSSYSQQSSEPTPEKNENDSQPIVSHMTEWLADLDAKMDELDREYQADSSWLSEKQTGTSVNSSSQENVPTQDMPATAELFPPPAKPAPAHTFPDLRAGLNERDVRQITTAEQKRIDAAEQRQKEQREKKRTLEVWELFDTLFGSSVDRYGYNKPHVTSLAKNTLATNAVITTAFNAVANSQAVKNNPAKLTITEIANVVPSYIRAEQIKVVSSHNKPKSFEEQYAESERATKEFEAKERAAKERRAREAQERMVAAR